MNTAREDAFAAHRDGDFERAERLYREILAAAPSDAEARHYLGVLCRQTDRIAESARWLREAADLAPRSLPTLELLIRVCDEMGNAEGALFALDLYLAQRPDDASMLRIKGLQLVRAGRLRDAELVLRDAANRSGNGATHHDLGLCRQLLGDAAGAARAYREALRRGHHSPRTGLWLAQSLRASGQIKEYYDAAMAAARAFPEDAATLIEAQSARRYVCDWDGFNQNLPALLALLHRIAEDDSGENVPPGVLNYLDVDEKTIAAIACRHARRLSLSGKLLREKLRDRPRSSHDKKIRLGYLSADFFAHAIGSLVRDLFASHDRGRFAVYGYALRHQGDAVQARIEQGFDVYRNLSGRTATDIAQTIMDDGIDILIDLAGYTSAAQPVVLAARVAPIQISWLGYLGTSGGDYMDYLIGDDVVLPPHVARHYTERVIRLPHFLVASPLSAAEDRPAREDLGLEQGQFVFCSFNQAYKLDRRTFTAWMQILSAVPGSVLWMYVPDSEVCAANLRHETGRLGVAPHRLVFAGHEPMDRHIARLSAADLALDPFHISGGATTVAALAAGLPVLSCRGNSFLSRMGSAVNVRLGTPELDCETPEQYVAKAVELASMPALLSATSDRLNAALRTRGYFDVPRFARTLEAGLEIAWQRHQAGRPPADIRVS